MAMHNEKEPDMLNFPVLFFDLGDTIMVEETEVKDSEGTTQQADLVPGMADLLRRLKTDGFTIALVADSRPNTPIHVLDQHGLLPLFDFLAISENVGAEKPSAHIFEVALQALAIQREDYGRVVMIGNNLERDVVGANRLGLVSVFFHLNDRRRITPLTEEETPKFTVCNASELASLIYSL
jgi:FMN phosphatase YigB (HAD superfamily)